MFHVEHVAPGAAPAATGAAGWRVSPGSGRNARFAEGHALRGGAGPPGVPRPVLGRAARILLTAILLLSPGCAGVRSVRLFFPVASGVEMARPGLYVDPGMTAPRREAFAADLEEGKRRAAEFYRGLDSSPDIVACASIACYRRFGGVGKGMTGIGGILLSPEGLNPAIVAHEWSHAEFAKRVGRLRRWWSVPQWFDEGLAVLVSRDPEYSEEAWRAATDNGTKAPPLSDLETLRGWLRVTGKGGKTKQLSYGTARREVAGWYAVAGPDGLDELIEGLRYGEGFSQLYERTGKASARTGCSTWNSRAGADAAGEETRWRVGDAGDR